MTNRGTTEILWLKCMLLGVCRIIPSLRNRTQIVVALPAPLNFATPFPMFRYQKQGDIGNGVTFSAGILHFTQSFYSVFVQDSRTSF